MTRNRLLLESFGFAVLSLVVFGGLGVLGIPMVAELAGLEASWPLVAFVAASPFALLGGYFWFKHRVVRPGVA